MTYGAFSKATYQAMISCLAICLCAPLQAEEPRREIKVVVAAMYEIGAPRGDAPGELQFWVERLPLEEAVAFPLGEEDLYLNDEGVLAILLGGGIPNATASVMALGLDSRFDLTKAYWIIAGVAGGDPADLSLGSAAWARHVVDGDLAYEIDAREIPADWPYGLFPLGSQRPAQDPQDLSGGWTLDTVSFSLNRSLVDWAYDISKDTAISDAAGIAEYRKLFDGMPAAVKPPFVTIGDTLSSSTYWHGDLLNEWANDWLKLYAGADANFMTSNMEDSGTLTALHRLARRGLVDSERILVLRTASNYTTPPPGKTAVWSKNTPYPDGGRPALESAFVVGNTVVQALLENWSEYRDRLPGQRPQE